MSRRIMLITVVAILTTFALSLPALAAPPPDAKITGVTMIQSSFAWADCGAELSATFANIGHGGYRVVLGIRDHKSGTTITTWERLTYLQPSASFQLGSCAGEETVFDRGEVTLYRGARVVDSLSIDATITCPG